MAAGARTVRAPVTIVGGRAGQRPIVVWVLIALNVAVFAVTAAQAGSLLDNNAAPLFEEWALSPALAAQGQWWRLLTAGFLHYGPIHLLFNMLALWIIGRDLEGALGRVAFVSIYLVGLFGGSAAVLLVRESSLPVAGASGAVFALMGGLAVVLRRMRIPAGQVLGLIAINVVLTFTLPFLSKSGHLGGLVVGVLATAALVYAPQRHRIWWQAAALGGLLAVLVTALALTSRL